MINGTRNNKVYGPEVENRPFAPPGKAWGDMRLSQYIEREPEVRRKKVKPAKASIATHGAFVPILGLWGAALFGLTVLVLPDAMVERFSALSGGAVTGASARLTFAAVATVLGGALAFVIGGALRSAALRQDTTRPIACAVHSRTARPIDPARELGSPSLDAPLDAEPFAGEEQEAEFEPVAKPERGTRGPTLGELAQRGYEMEAPEDAVADATGKKEEVVLTHKKFRRALIESCEGATCEASPGSDEHEAPTPIKRKPMKRRPARSAAAKSAPRELDLAEFADLPGRNAVWVEDAAGAPHARAPIPANALQKLRQTPTDKLSLVEMVERFAGALHEHQTSERARRPDGSVGRDAALVEALKALTLFTEQGFDQPGRTSSPREQLGKTERELREALTKLQTLRGAA